MGVLEGQEHVLEDRQGSSPDNGIQKLGENLEERSWSGVPQAWAPDAKCSHRPERWSDTLELKQ